MLRGGGTDVIHAKEFIQNLFCWGGGGTVKIFGAAPHSQTHNAPLILWAIPPTHDVTISTAIVTRHPPPPNE